LLIVAAHTARLLDQYLQLGDSHRRPDFGIGKDLPTLADKRSQCKPSGESFGGSLTGGSDIGSQALPLGKLVRFFSPLCYYYFTLQ
jgi:hypothetical protein